METIQIQTLVDITNTRVIRPNQGTPLEYDQNRNFITLRQCVELRSIVFFDNPPHIAVVDITGMGFGKAFNGKHRVWTFKFTPDRAGVYTDSTGNVIGNLLDDMNAVPIIKNLTESINIEKAIFNCKDMDVRNTIIQVDIGTI